MGRIIMKEVKKEKRVWTDYHTHCLPGMDDGAKDVDTAVRMLQILGAQDVGKVAATPHFSAERESVSEFLRRRQDAYDALTAHPLFPGLPPIMLGAEIRLEPDLAGTDLRPLCIGDSALLLLELPFIPYKPWMLEEIRNITYAMQIIPLLAHVERYQTWYSKADFEQLLSFEEGVLQINVEALRGKRSLHFVKQRMKEGRKLLLGSDCHNLTDRSPNFSEVGHLASKMGMATVIAYLLACEAADKEPDDTGCFGVTIT